MTSLLPEDLRDAVIEETISQSVQVEQTSSVETKPARETKLISDVINQKEANPLDSDKIVVHIRAGPNTPILKQSKFKISGSENFEAIIDFLRKQLRLNLNQPLFCYINAVFCPTQDQNIMDLFKCFNINNELLVNYCLTDAWS